MNDNILSVWLHSTRLGELERLRSGKMGLRFAADAIATYGAQSQVLSLSLPLTSKRVGGHQLDTFVQGLLPEQTVRAVIEDENHVPRNDDFALLRTVGAECAGSVQVLRADASPSEGALRDLTDAEVNEIVRGLPTLHAPDALPITASLGGIQAKVLLAETDTGWSWPALGAISTHIIKPEPNANVVVAHLIEGEHWTSELARTAGLSAAHTELHEFGGRLAIVIERYDRAAGKRLHQEDFTQALGLGAQYKYETSSVPPSRLTRIAKEAEPASLDPAGFKETLLRMVTFNALIGNSDAHSKNYSLLIDTNGNVELAPLYDAAPTLLMNRALTTTGHALDGQTDLRHITRRHLENEASAWGVDISRAEEIVDEIAASVATALDTVRPIAELSYLSDLIQLRAQQLRSDGIMQHILAPGDSNSSSRTARPV
ncbi:MAG: type II toxin-antitoxin system HipA family toxin [Lacisediminihabitans sp.]